MVRRSAVRPSPRIASVSCRANLSNARTNLRFIVARFIVDNPSFGAVLSQYNSTNTSIKDVVHVVLLSDVQIDIRAVARRGLKLPEGWMRHRHVVGDENIFVGVHRVGRTIRRVGPHDVATLLIGARDKEL